MQEETEVLGENLNGQVWIENQIHIRLWPDSKFFIISKYFKCPL